MVWQRDHTQIPTAFVPKGVQVIPIITSTSDIFGAAKDAYPNPRNMADPFDTNSVMPFRYREVETVQLNANYGNIGDRARYGSHRASAYHGVGLTPGPMPYPGVPQWNNAVSVPYDKLPLSPSSKKIGQYADKAIIQDTALVYQPPTIAKLKSQLASISSQFKGG